MAAVAPPSPAHSPSIVESDLLWSRARGLIPGGTQTYAKGPGQYVGGVAPKYLRRGKGARVWDVDGNEYLDLGMAVGPIVLGYGYAAVDDAIRRQLEDGITFSLMHPLEVEVAEQIRAMVPCAESVRYSKTGADVTSAAVRAARAFTGREKVLCCGYHGWHDWYIATTDRAGGIPGASRDLTFTFEYNDPASFLAAIGDDVACVILEPMVFEAPAPGFLELLRAECTKHGALLVFDEMWTGFRVAAGGAQARFNVTPDLATFSKAIANGMPLSVLAGRKDVMRLFERDLFFYTTFGGEALSLAAAQATMSEIARNDVPAHLERVGGAMRDGYNAIAAELGIAEHTACVGAGCRSLVTFTGVSEPLVYKSLLQQELIRRDLLWSGGHVVSYSHTDADAQFVVDTYAEVLPLMADAIRQDDARRHLRGSTVEPAFRRASQFNTKPAPSRAPSDATPGAAPAGLARFSLADSVVLVTGAGGLLGREHALAVAEAGGTVVLIDLARSELTPIAALCRETGARAVSCIAADVTNRDDVERALRDVLKQFGRVDALVNNAALNDKVEAPALESSLTQLEDYPLDAWRRMLDVNVTGVFLPCQVIGAHMVERGAGSIINVASTYALVGPDPAIYAHPDGSPGHCKAPAYAASKGAVVALTRQFAAAWGRHGVRVNTLVPGGVENGQPKHFVDAYARRTPLGRMAAPHDYRGALVFLASNASTYMTGTTLVVDGGFICMVTMTDSNVLSDARCRAAAIRLLLTDCDGVLTDGSVFCGPDGESLLQFSRRDGMGVARLREIGVTTQIVTRESSPIVVRRAEKLGIDMVHLGVFDKRQAVEQIIAAAGLTPDQVAYVGDDVNDLEVLDMVGLAACPVDAEPIVRHRVHTVLRHGGGKGALRELAEFIIEARGAGESATDAPHHDGATLRLVAAPPRRWRALGNRAIGDGEPVYVIGEIGINHNGSLEIAKKLIDGAIAAGCDCVKFQKRTPELCVPADQQHLERDTPWGRITYLEYRHRVEFTFAQYAEIDRYCRERGVAWTASCWDEPSADCIAEFDVPFIKVASASLTDHTLMRHIASKGVQVMVSTGMSTQQEIDAAAAVIESSQLLVAHSTSAYPCPPRELNLRMIETLADAYPGVPIGYSGHEVGLATTYAAVALGASFVERHITLDRAMWGSDQSASVEIVGLRRMVRDIRSIEEAVGDGVKRVYASEYSALRRLRRATHDAPERVATA